MFRLSLPLTFVLWVNIPQLVYVSVRSFIHLGVFLFFFQSYFLLCYKLLHSYLIHRLPQSRLLNNRPRIDQIIKCMLGIPPHWERAYGENYLYEILSNLGLV